ncbi:MAG: hypothetical protein Q9183_001757 [Haloplaca sp. 2 TL-2023]
MEHQARQSSAKQFPFTQFVEHNRLGVIENPLRRIPEEKLKDYIESFHEINRLGTVVDPATLVRGARLARDEEGFVAEEKAVENLTFVESTALDKEKGTTIWSETREIKIILLICCVGSVLQGWVSRAIRLSRLTDSLSRALKPQVGYADSRNIQAQGAIVAANQIWPKEFINPEFSLNLGELSVLSTDVWIFSATNAIVYFAASSVGAFMCDPLTEITVGRRGALFVAALFSLAASIGEALTHSWQALFACRL